MNAYQIKIHEVNADEDARHTLSQVLLLMQEFPTLFVTHTSEVQDKVYATGLAEGIDADDLFILLNLCYLQLQGYADWQDENMGGIA